MATNNNIALDLLRMFRELQFKGDTDKTGGYTDTISRYLLVHMGFTLDTVDEANSLFWEKIENNKLGDLGDVAARVADFAKDSDWIKEYIISSMGAIVEVQNTSVISDEQKNFYDAFLDLLDMKPSQFQSAFKKGIQWGIALKFTANAYAENGRYKAK